MLHIIILGNEDGLSCTNPYVTQQKSLANVPRVFQFGLLSSRKEMQGYSINISKEKLTRGLLRCWWAIYLRGSATYIDGKNMSQQAGTCVVSSFIENNLMNPSSNPLVPTILINQIVVMIQKREGEGEEGGKNDILLISKSRLLSKLALSI